SPLLAGQRRYDFVEVFFRQCLNFGVGAVLRGVRHPDVVGVIAKRVALHPGGPERRTSSVGNIG
ncbi:MAG TPA: hypothetical protein QF861_10390, partial [Alphaproteobacteria bacterium]|nr:hypothetical protein [Alphaproteobacteria bacterium]